MTSLAGSVPAVQRPGRARSSGRGGRPTRSGRLVPAAHVVLTHPHGGGQVAHRDAGAAGGLHRLVEAAKRARRRLGAHRRSREGLVRSVKRSPAASLGARRHAGSGSVDRCGPLDEATENGAKGIVVVEAALAGVVFPFEPAGTPARHRERPGHWKTEQTRSYFAIKLVPGWWLWAVDTQFDTYIDPPQLSYFRSTGRRGA